MRIPKSILLLFALSIATGVSFAADVGQPEKERPLTEIVSQSDLGSQVDVIEIIRNDVDDFAFVSVYSPAEFTVTNFEIVTFFEGRAPLVNFDSQSERLHKYRCWLDKIGLANTHRSFDIDNCYRGERIFAFC